MTKISVTAPLDSVQSAAVKGLELAGRTVHHTPGSIVIFS